MSIKNPSGHIPKRRKLSHSSSEGLDKDMAQAEKTIDQDSALSSDEAPKLLTEKRTIRKLAKPKTVGSISGNGPVTRTSVMALQVEGLLDEVRPNHESRLRQINPIIERVIEVIKSTPERPAQLLASAEKSLRKQHVAIPFAGHRPDSEVKYQFAFQSPQNIWLRGGLARHTSLRGSDEIELAVHMPSAMFQEKDYLNDRALHKRAYYLACLASAFQQNLKGEATCSYALKDGNALLPFILLVFSTGDTSVELSVNVTLPSEIGPVEKMLPGKNCLRSAVNETSTTPGQLSATPFYNNSVRTIASLDHFEKLLGNAAKQCEAFRGMCTLGQVWLQQRGLDGSLSGGGFGAYEWSTMCALLLSSGGHKDQPLFSDRYSVIQLFKAMLQVLSGRDLMEQPIVINADKMDLSNSTQAVFYDGATGVNLLYKMSVWSYNTLKAQAQLSLTAANNRNENNFDSLFIWRGCDPTLQFDEIWSVDISALDTNQQTQYQTALSKLHDVFKRGLGDRISTMSIRQPASKRWDLGKSEPKQSQLSSTIEICLHINPDTFSRTVDHGPSAEEKEESKDFRKFWGDKAELRRFRDGSISEALVWSDSSSITFQIIQYLAAYHFRIAPSLVKAKHHNLSLDFADKNLLVQSTDAFEIVNKKYQELSSKLHQLEGLPLSVRSVSPVDPALRSATMGHPLSPSSARPINMLIQFDSSGRWPDNLPAIQYTKVAFLAKLSDLLSEADSSLETRLGVENDESSHTGYYNTSFLDIVSPSPASGLTPIVFRLRVHHDREQHLLQTAITSATSANREALTIALIDHKRDCLASPHHTAAIRNLITHFPPLSSTITLLKTWISHHHLSNHIPAPTLELIAAHIFLHPSPWSVPGSATTAFLRCLHFLSHWDWSSRPLIIDLSLSQDMPASAHTDLETRFQAWKKLDPGMNNVAWFIGTNVDSTGTIWTQGARPSKVVAGRATALAKAAIGLLRSKGTDMADHDWKDLFVSPLVDFDFVIHLKKSVARGGRKTNSNGLVKFKNLQVQEDLDVDSVGHDVTALYMDDLEKCFGNCVLFFRGEGGRIIAGLWKPSALGTKEWRVRLGWSSSLVSNEGERDGDAKCIINKDAMMVEMAALGEGMVEKITLKS